MAYSLRRFDLQAVSVLIIEGLNAIITNSL